MPNMSTEKMIGWLYRLVDILHYHNQYAWKLLQKVTGNKATIIQIDNCKLSLKSVVDKSYKVLITVAEVSAVPNFHIRAETLHRIVSGNILLDTAIVKQDIYIRAPFEDLVAIYRLITCLLAEGALNSHLRKLWTEFDREWPTNFPSFMLPLEYQKPFHGYLIHKIPENVLLIKT
jgi:hypothetical protein